MIKLLFLLILSVPLLLEARPISKGGLEAYLDSYFEKQLTQSIQRAVPEAKFSLIVRTGLNQQLLNSSSEAPLRLPLGGSFLLEHEVEPDAREESGLKHPESYREAINSVQVELAWQGELEEEMRVWLKQHVLQVLRLSAEAVHEVKITALPIGFKKMNEVPEKLGWLESKFPELQGISSHESAALLLASVAALFAFLGFAMRVIVSGGQFFGFARIFKEGTGRVADALTEAASLQAPTPAPATGSATASDLSSVHSSGQAHGENRWNSVQLPELKAFVYDCLEHPLYESAAIILAHQFLNSNQAEELKAQLPAHFFDVDGPGRVLAPNREIEQLFFQHQMQYVLLAGRPLVEALLSYTVPQALKLIGQLIHQSKLVESLSVLNRLTPVKREMVLEKLGLDERLKLADSAQEKVAPQELERIEASLAQALQRPTTHATLAHAVQYPFRAIGTELFKARSFVEDEAIHELQTSQGKASPSVLAALDALEDEAWLSIPLNEVALAFFGFSSGVHERLLVNFDEKRRDWLKSFMQKYAQTKVRWDSPEAEASRRKILGFLNLDSSTTVSDNEEDEPLQLRKAA